MTDYTEGLLDATLDKLELDSKRKAEREFASGSIGSDSIGRVSPREMKGAETWYQESGGVVSGSHALDMLGVAFDGEAFEEDQDVEVCI